MLHHSFGGAVIYLSLQHFIATALDLMPWDILYDPFTDHIMGKNTLLQIVALIQ